MRGRARILLAIDASAVAGAVVSGPLGAPRIKSFARVRLDPDALRPGPLEPNVLRPAEVAQAVRDVVAALDGAAGPATLILPDGVARTLLLDVAGGVAAREFARYRIAPGLPYPPEQALVDIL